MGDIDRCFFSGCQNIPKLICNCPNPQIMCPLHTQEHITQNQTLQHDIKLRFVSMSKDWLRRLPQLKLNLLQAKTLSLSELLKKYNLKIRTIKNQLKQSTLLYQQRILKVSQKYDKVIDSIQTLLDCKEIPQNWNPQSIQKLFDLDIKTIKNLSQLMKGQNYKFLYYLRNKSLYQINVQNKKINKISLHSLPQNIHRHSAVIDWDLKTVFQFGSYHLSSCYKIQKYSGKVQKLPDIPLGKIYLQGSILFGKQIYLFGGYKQNPNQCIRKCFCFNTENWEWTQIADLPTDSDCNSAVKVGKQILVSGYYMQGVYKYNLQSDSFCLLLSLNKSSHKTLFKTSTEEVIVISGGNGVFKSQKEDLGKWYKIGQQRINSWSVTDRVEYQGNVYYLDLKNNLDIFDINSKEIKQVSLNLNQIIRIRVEI